MAFPVFGVGLELEAAWGMEGLCGLWCGLALELLWGAAFRAGLVGWKRQRKWMVSLDFVAFGASPARKRQRRWMISLNFVAFSVRSTGKRQPGLMVSSFLAAFRQPCLLYKSNPARRLLSNWLPFRATPLKSVTPFCAQKKNVFQHSFLVAGKGFEPPTPRV